MKKTTRLISAALLALAPIAAPAFEFEISLWRGETTDALVWESQILGEAPAGLTVRRATLKPVKYAPSPMSVQLLEARDRVAWDGEDPGPQIVEVTADPDMKPGVYKCGMVDIRVVDRVLPPAKEWKYYLDLWQHPWAVSRWHGVEPFSDAHFRAMRPIWEMLASAGQKTLTCTLLDRPWDHQCFDAYGSMIGRVKRADGSWKFDYTVFDRYVAFGRSCGLGPDIACYTMCPWGYVVRYQKEDGETVAVKCKPGEPAFDDYWGDFLVDFAAHLKAKGWFKDTLIAMDERSPEDVRYIVDFVRRKAPGLRISMAGSFSAAELKEMAIESYCSHLKPERLTPEYLALVPERRAKGMITTYYVCCSPARPNTFLSNGPGEAFWVGVFPAFAGLDGLLRWAWNSWPRDPMQDATFARWAAGDTYFVYPDGSPSWRFLELRNGIVAAEKLRILKERGLFADEIAKLLPRFDVKKATEGKCDFASTREAVMKLVNRGK